MQKQFKSSRTQRERSRDYYFNRKARGLCQKCPNPSLPGLTRCQTCREIDSDYCAGRRDIRILQGLCSRCGRNPAEIGQLCTGCSERSRELDRNRKRKT